MLSFFHVIDGNSFIYRAYYALPPLTTSYGLKINAAYGLTRMLLKIINEEKPDYILICFDTPKPTFRHFEYTGYKATRKKMEDDLKPQISIIKEIINSLGIKSVELEGYEADDLIATVVNRFSSVNLKIKILSNDKDALQLIDKNIAVYSDSKKKEYNIKDVIDEYGVPPKLLPDLFAIIGDEVDNIPKVSGLGRKTAISLINRYGSIEEIIQKVDTFEPAIREIILQNKETLMRNKKILKLVNNIDLSLNIEDCKPKEPNYTHLYELFKKYEFHSLIKQLKIPVSEKKEFIDVFSIDELKEILPKIEASNKISILPIEKNKNVIGLAISTPNNNYFIKFARVDKKIIMEFLSNIIKNVSIEKIFHDAKSVLHLFDSVYITPPFFDTMLAAYLLDPSKGLYDLSSISFDYSSQKIPQIEINEKVAQNSVIASSAMLNLSNILKTELKLHGLEKIFYEVELPLIEVIYTMEKNGVKINIELLKELLNEFHQRLQKIEEEIIKEVGVKFNLNSPQQLAFILFEKLNLPKIKKTKTGYSTDSEVLKKLLPFNPIIEKILEYREIQKLKSTYVESLLEMVDTNGRVHTKFNQTGTSTGRLSSTSPNLQNIPIKTELGKRIRKAFIPEEGCFLVSADYSQIELRILAHVSKDKELIDAFSRNKDIHSTTAEELFGINYDNVSYEQRRIAKIVNFGIIYGISAQGLADELSIPIYYAQEYINKYFQKYRNVKKWITDTLNEARKNKFVKTLMGRMRFLPDINSKNPNVRAASERIAINTPIQGTAADIIKKSMVELYLAFKEKKMATKLLLQIHDELLFEVPQDEVSSAIKVIKERMENAYPLDVPINVEIKIGKNWAEMESV